MSRCIFKKQRMKEGRKEGKKEDLTKLIFEVISSDLYSENNERSIQMIYEMQTKMIKIKLPLS